MTRAQLYGRRLAHADPSPSATTLRRALDLGVSFLRRRQSRNGVWKGFRLPPGPATTWLTAHVAWVCEEVPALRDARTRAALHLRHIGPEDGGWGYNRRVGVDSDSTAQALLVLGCYPSTVPHFLLETLLRAQLPEGGFATYSPRAGRVSGWHAAHPDVTIVAVAALRRYGLHEAEERALEWLAGEGLRSGFASYWWPGTAYGLWARARVHVRGPGMTTAVTAALAGALPTPQGAQLLAAALALGLEGEHEKTTEAAAAQILGTQLTDGSWPCSPCLRVTDPRETETLPELPGRVYADERRIFSTAHAVAALQAMFDRVGRARPSDSSSIPVETG